MSYGAGVVLVDMRLWELWAREANQVSFFFTGKE
jgi:hypothetical protein